MNTADTWTSPTFSGMENETDLRLKMGKSLFFCGKDLAFIL